MRILKLVEFFVLASVTVASPAINARAAVTGKACNADNLERCFRVNAGAVDFCRAYVKATTTFTTVTPTSFVIISPSPTFGDIPKIRAARDDAARLPANVTSPACLTRDGTKTTSYPASRITSACSCIGETPSAVTRTRTAPAATYTIDERTTYPACYASFLSGSVNFNPRAVEGGGLGLEQSKRYSLPKGLPFSVCCSECFRRNCLYYEYNYTGLGTCDIIVLTASKNSNGVDGTVPTNYTGCPFGQYVLGLDLQTGQDGGAGLGPCGTIDNLPR